MAPLPRISTKLLFLRPLSGPALQKQPAASKTCIDGRTPEMPASLDDFQTPRSKVKKKGQQNLHDDLVSTVQSDIHRSSASENDSRSYRVDPVIVYIPNAPTCSVAPAEVASFSYATSTATLAEDIVTSTLNLLPATVLTRSVPPQTISDSTTSAMPVLPVVTEASNKSDVTSVSLTRISCGVLNECL
ncbi:hypothetical protein BC830DRAFT_1173324 [Chytriomyces sp. MP71]|nr:hypothetical protein BC830DRAFT_1173324 [Chytriomyces sp. MP71]